MSHEWGRQVDPREVRARLDTPVVRTLLEKGYSLSDLKETIEERLRTNGDDFRSMTELVLALQAAKDRRTSRSAASSFTTTPPNTAEASRQQDYLSSLPREHISQYNSSSSRNGNQTRFAAVQGTSNITAEGSDSLDQLASISSTSRYFSDEEAERIRLENRDLREARQCKLCLDAEIGVVILPCGHACTCPSCSAAVTHCPICRMFIRGTVKIAQ